MLAVDITYYAPTGSALMCRRTHTASRLMDLPREILALILTLCYGPDLPALARVCIDFDEQT